jgi:lipopolysaccharide export system protein LptA
MSEGNMFSISKASRPIFVILFIAAYPVYAIDPNSNLPIQIESDRASLNDETGISNYSGNVIISQGLSRLEAENISVNAVNRKIVSIKATGNPAHFTQQDDVLSTGTHGYGEKIVYIASEEILKFFGGAKLVQQDNSFSGEQIEYDIVRKAIKAKGDESIGSRVKIQYYPNPKTSSTETPEPSMAPADTVTNTNTNTETEAKLTNENP